MRCRNLSWTLSLVLVTIGCAAGGSDTGGASASGGANPSGGSSNGGGSCVDGEERCEGADHQLCQGGTFTASPCPDGSGCDAATGACATCTCTPGETAATCPDVGSESVCDASCTGFTSQPCPATEVCIDGSCGPPLCVPGTSHCEADNGTSVCNATGTGYDPGPTCGAKEVCTETLGCESLCSAYAKTPSSVGCSFFALNMDNFSEVQTDGVIVGNTSSTLTAVVNFYTSYNGVEALAQSNLQVPPLSQVQINLPNGAVDVIHGISALRKGGAFRIESDIPVVAYQHSPLAPQATNDASLLLPESTLAGHYFVPSYSDALGYPSYFNVVGTQDGTMVTIKLSNANAGGTGVPATAAGGTMTVMLDRYDTLQVVNAPGGTTASRDLTGSEIVSDKPISVFGAVECAQIPAGFTYCDHIEEQAVPSRNWGKTYVGAHIPKRSNSEHYIWRVMAQDDGTVIDTTPQVAGFPITLAKGQFYEFSTNAGPAVETGSFILTSSKPFAAVQYVTGQDAFGAGTGDPAMITAVPVEQFLNRYVILTPSGYTANYVQIIRSTADPVSVDGVDVPESSYYTLGAYTVADVLVSDGPHTVLSNSPFGLIGAGYTAVTSYGYPGGLALNNIAPN